MSSVECPVIEERAALAHLVNTACLSFHPWNARVDALDRPDRMVFNLDPTEIGFREVRLAALLVRDLLARHQVRSWVKTSGGSGLHVVIPLRPTHGFDEVRATAAFISRAARAREPKLFTGEVRPSRRRGRIRIDVERNRAGAALTSPFSVRVDCPLVSMPVEWHELERALYPEDFPLTAVRARLETVGDPWRTMADEPQSIDHRHEPPAGGDPILAILRARRGSPAGIEGRGADTAPVAEPSAGRGHVRGY
jgi:bifunctional non-homologous end joining protein LigD